MKLVGSIKRHTTAIISATAFSLLTISAVHAAAECKGMGQPDCEAAGNQCTWIKGYETKTGNQVKAYCRTKPKKKPTPTTPSTQ